MAYGPELQATYNDGAVVTLRQPSREELAPFFPTDEVVQQFVVRKWAEYLQQPTPDAYTEHVLGDSRLINWGLCVGTTPRLVGTVGMHEDSWFYTYILDPNSHGQGYGTRASRLALAAAFALRPNLANIVTYVNHANGPSIRMTEKLGMARDAAYDTPGRSQARFVLARPALSGELQDNFAKILGALGEDAVVDLSPHTLEPPLPDNL